MNTQRFDRLKGWVIVLALGTCFWWCFCWLIILIWRLF